MKYRIREQNELKPSSVEWLGDIPKDWEYYKNKYIFKRINNNVGNYYDNYKVLSLTLNGVIERNMNNMGKMPSSFSIYQIVEKDSLILCLFDIDVTPRIIGYVNIQGIISSAYTNLIVKSLYSKYYYYWFLTLNNQNILLNYTKSLRNTINNENFMSLESLVCSFFEQQKIANFLDEKSKIFDEAISKKEQLISKLELAKQSLISEVVTGKLKIIEQNSKLQTIKREKNELKPSGVEWLGDIPKDWKLTKLKYLGDAIIGLTYSPTDVVDKNEGKLVLRSSNVQNKRITFEDNVYVKSEIPKKLLTKIDDILICSRNGSRNLIGKNALITENSQDLTFGAFMTIFRSKYNKYLFYIFNSDIFEAQSASFLSSTINQLTTGNLNNFKIVLPSLEEQQKISKYLDEKLIHFDNTIEKTKQSITKLKEAKEALISQAVTGKIEVIQEEAKSTNEYFKRRVLAAYFIDKSQDDLSFGRVKLQKMLYMAEAVNNLDFSSSYTRHAMGPHDPQMIRSIESQLKKAKWFEAKKIKNNNFEKVEYLALEKSKEYMKYLDGRYWKQENIEYIFNLMKGMKTLQTEIVATVYSAYIDLSKENRVSQDNLLDEILNHWHDNKRNVPKEKWIRAIEWMSEKQLIKI